MLRQRMFNELTLYKIYLNQSCDIAPKNAAAFDLTLAKFCCVVDCVDVMLLFDGDFLCKHKNKTFTKYYR